MAGLGNGSRRDARGAADRLLQRRQLAAGASGGATERDRHAPLFGGGSWALDPAVADRKLVAGRFGRRRRAAAGLVERRAAGVGVAAHVGRGGLESPRLHTGREGFGLHVIDFTLEWRGVR